MYIYKVRYGPKWAEKHELYFLRSQIGVRIVLIA